jgi:hypothetical protein
MSFLNYYLFLSAIGLTPGGSITVQYSTVHYTFTHKQYTECRERKIHNNKKNKLGSAGRALSASYTLAFALQLWKNYGKSSFRVVEKCPNIPVAVAQHSIHLHTNSTQNNGMRQNIQNGTYTIIRILKLTEEHIT